MSKRSDEVKRLVIEKLAELTMIGQAQGAISGDNQILFIAETSQVVLNAGMNEAEAGLLHKHVQNYLNEMQMLKGNISVINHLMNTHRPGVN